MRKAFQAGAALAAVALLAAGCAKPSSSTTTTTSKFKGCMVTDTGGINDKSFNQSSWEGMQAAASASGGAITV